jgi:hypothetical protein
MKNVQVSSESQQFLCNFGWILFLAAKVEILPESQDLLHVFSLILCILRFLLQCFVLDVDSMPSSSEMSQSSYSSSDSAGIVSDLKLPQSEWGWAILLSSANPSQSPSSSDIVASCKSMNINQFLPFLLEVYRDVIQKLAPDTDFSGFQEDNVVLHSLIDVVRICSQVNSGKYVWSFGTPTAIKDLQSPEDILNKALSQFGSIYDSEVSKVSSILKSSLWIDERLFLQESIDSKSMYSVTESPATAARRQISFSVSPFSPILRSPRHLATPRTPFSQMMECVHWLTKTCSPSVEEFRACLIGFLNSERMDCFSVIDEVISWSTPRIYDSLPHTAFSSSESWKYREEMGVKLFYKLLFKLFSYESEKKKSLPISWVSSSAFYKCVLACSFEIVVTSYKLPRFKFPTIITILEVSAFELFKVVEAVIQSDTSRDLPSSLKEHFSSVEIEILEHFAWRSTDALVPLLSSRVGKEFLSLEFSQTNVRSEASTDRSQLALVLFYRRLMTISSSRLKLILSDCGLSHFDSVARCNHCSYFVGLESCEICSWFCL